ncbi:helix-turn-helix transcriptional regulator [Amycolatopsis granulosa]|uniref:helix-turn-helix transcriptional regulator n=1 Tax=Amycolatopsis granulosa TaxID=185684 RepID=UPI001FB8B894|nr:helix-turn-helix transcriptional regulator [Amycolatopsis granulosa]NIH85716.1 transcriptional regulator with XRE-family HTH domain [Amycolatopsis granulosa]
MADMIAGAYGDVMATEARIGGLLRDWRRRRRLSQLDLALQAETSARHLSCVETGRARASREMVLRLCAALDVPLRERNTLLLAAGYAPAYRESSLDDEEMTGVRAALDTMLETHEPYPAVVVDRCWTVLAANRGMALLMAGVPPELLLPRPNVFRLALHPEGLASRLVNLREVRRLFLDRLRRQVQVTGDGELRALYEEVCAYAPPDGGADDAVTRRSPIEVPLRLRTPHGELALFSTMATFGAPADVTLSELAIELFYPLDEVSRQALCALAR